MYHKTWITATTEMSNRFLLLVFLVILVHSFPSFSSDFSDNSTRSPLGFSYIKKKKKRGGTNIKVSPALYWKSIVVGGEFPLGNRFSTGINLFAKYGLNDKRFAYYSTQNEKFFADGISGELYFRYYLKKTAPEGFYFHTYFNYNQILYFDGSVRPYTLYNTWDKAKLVKKTAGIGKPLPYSGGLGTGYQFILIPDKIIGDVLLGVQGNIDADNSFFVSVFLLPSIGYKF